MPCVTACYENFYIQSKLLLIKFKRKQDLKVAMDKQQMTLTQCKI